MWEKNDHVPPFPSIEVEESLVVRTVYALSIQRHHAIGLEKRDGSKDCRKEQRSRTSRGGEET